MASSSDGVPRGTKRATWIVALTLWAVAGGVARAGTVVETRDFNVLVDGKSAGDAHMTITRYEDNQLFLADINANEQQRQTTIVRRVNKTLPYVRALGTASAVLTVLIIGIYTWDSWLKIRS